MEKEKIQKVIEDFRNFFIEAAIEKYEDASIAGLCAEGAWEAAIDAVRNLDLNQILTEINKNKSLNNKKE